VRPEVQLLDARDAGLSEAELREWARTLRPAADAPHSSRSYRYPYALLAWHDQPVGVDIERIESVDPGFARSICTYSEQQALTELDDRLVASLWCGKEALSKALGDPLLHDPRRLEAPLMWPDGRAGPWRAAELSVADGHVAWLCWRAAQATGG
jgi:phosphopantetheinyl transferase